MPYWRAASRGGRRVAQELAEAGIGPESVARRLENEGIMLFATSYADLLSSIEAKRSPLAPRQLQEEAAMD